MKYYEIIATVFQVTTLFMLLRSCLFMVRVKKDFKTIDFSLMIAVLITGIGITGYNITDPFYFLQRFPFNSIFFLGSAWAFFIVTKAKKEDLYSIHNVLKQELSRDEKLAISKINSEDNSTEEIESVPSTVLDKFVMHKWMETCKKTMLIRLTPPNKLLDYKFRAELLTGGFFKEQEHPDLHELLYVDSGVIEDKSTGKIYRAGDYIDIPPGTPHFPIALERASITAYLFKV